MIKGKVDLVKCSFKPTNLDDKSGKKESCFSKEVSNQNFVVKNGFKKLPTCASLKISQFEGGQKKILKMIETASVYTKIVKKALRVRTHNRKMNVI